jgi:hypothetical protein
MASLELGLLALLDVKPAFIFSCVGCSERGGLLTHLARQLKLCNPYPCIYLNALLYFSIDLFAVII